MDVVHWTQRPDLRRPLFVIAFEGWNDAGDAATLAVDYLAHEWNASRCATIDPEDFYDFTVTRPTVTTASDGARQVDWPQIELLAAELPGSRHDIVLLRGVEPQLRWRRFCRAVVSTVETLHAELVVVLGAMLSDVPHTRPVRVSGASTDPALTVRVGLTASSYQGPTGIVGVLLEALRGAGLPAASFWAAVPHYAHQLPSPKAALALVERSAALVGAPFDLVRLQAAADAYERQVSERVADDEDTADYVAQLEAAEDDADRLTSADGAATGSDGPLPAGPLTDGGAGDLTGWGSLPTADELAADVERFLRDQRGED